MKIGVSTWNYLKAFGDKADLRGALAEIRDHDFGAELWLDWDVDRSAFDRQGWAALRDWTLGMASLSMHSRLIHASDEKIIKEELELCAYLHGSLVVFHPKSFGFQVGTWDFESALPQPEAAYNLLFRSLEFAAENKIKLAFENGPLNLLDAVLRRISSRRHKDSFGFCFDTSHAQMHSAQYRAPMAEYISAIGKSIIHVHASDNHGENDDHLVPGTGTVDWKGLMSGLKKIGYDDVFVLELNVKDPITAAIQSRDFFK